jgi:hypothetical protein
LARIDESGADQRDQQYDSSNSMTFKGQPNGSLVFLFKKKIVLAGVGPWLLTATASSHRAVQSCVRFVST